MNIFITGIAGFLGSHLADALIAEGHKVSGCDNLIGGYLDNVPEDADFHQVDCSYLSTMKRLLKDIDIVYHTACTAYEGFSVFSPHIVCQNTFQNTVTTLTAAIDNKVKKFIYCSSMSRYGDQQVPYNEDMNTKPQDPYAISKVASEEVIKNLCFVHKMDYSIAIPHNIIGPRQKYDDPFRNVAAIMINMMLQEKQPIIYGDGEQKRCFSYIDDCIGSLVRLIDVSGVFNIGPDEEFVTINELAYIIADEINFKLKPRYYPDRPMEVKLCTCSADKARFFLGYETKTSLRKGIKKMIEYIKEKGTKKFRYHLDIEINNKKTPKTWTKQLF